MNDLLPLRLATNEDLMAVVELWNEASAWLGENGQSQWQYPVRVDAISERIAAERLWVMFDESGPVATVTLDENADPDLWPPSDHPESAFYLHRLVVARRCAGQQLGARILDWASEKTRHAGRQFLRLDAWTTNDRLHHYYLGQGFQLVRTIKAEHVVSGAAFERPV